MGHLCRQNSSRRRGFQKSKKNLNKKRVFSANVLSTGSWTILRIPSWGVGSAERFSSEVSLGHAGRRRVKLHLGHPLHPKYAAQGLWAGRKLELRPEASDRDQGAGPETQLWVPRDRGRRCSASPRTCVCARSQPGSGLAKRGGALASGPPQPRHLPPSFPGSGQRAASARDPDRSGVARPHADAASVAPQPFPTASSRGPRAASRSAEPQDEV